MRLQAHFTADELKRLVLNSLKISGFVVEEKTFYFTYDDDIVTGAVVNILKLDPTER